MHSGGCAKIPGVRLTLGGYKGSSNFYQLVKFPTKIHREASRAGTCFIVRCHKKFGMSYKLKLASLQLDFMVKWKILQLVLLA